MYEVSYIFEPEAGHRMCRVYMKLTGLPDSHSSACAQPQGVDTHMFMKHVNICTYVLNITAARPVMEGERKYAL